MKARMVKFAGRNRKDCFHSARVKYCRRTYPRALLAGYNQRYPKIQFALTTGRLPAHAGWRYEEGKLNAAFIDGR